MGSTPSPFTFIDLFAGIGGFRSSSEWDRYSRQTYEARFGEAPAGDIRQVKPHDVPAHDILAAGFPCQPFSIAGSKAAARSLP